MSLIWEHRLELTAEIVTCFAELSGDYSSLHMEADFARRTRYRRPIVHGMLPVTCLILIASAAKILPPLYLSKFSCQFLGPLAVGDTIVLRIYPPGQAGIYKFDIACKDSTDHATRGVLEFSQIAATEPNKEISSSRQLCVIPPTQNGFALEEIEVGQTESLDVCLDSRSLAALCRLLNCEASAVENGFLVFIPVSTLIGMRLPGKHAIFTGIEAEIISSPLSGLVTVTATLDKIRMASGSLQIALGWTANDRIVAQGRATAMISAAPSEEIRCQEIQARHLAFGITGKTALVTGASRGIGAATAKLLAMHGVKVVVHYFQGAVNAEAIVEDIRTQKGQAVALKADLRDEASIACMFKEIEKHFGGVDILINNAVGDYKPKAFADLNTDDFINEFKVTIFGAHACCRLALPHMRKNRWGKIVNLGSVATETPVTGQNKYITAKSALGGYTRSLAAETASDNIHVNMVVPNMTDTSLIAALPPSLVKKLAAENVTGRLLHPIDVAQAILFLASDLANPISGQKLVLNQGQVPYL